MPRRGAAWASAHRSRRRRRLARRRLLPHDAPLRRPHCLAHRCRRHRSPRRSSSPDRRWCCPSSGSDPRAAWLGEGRRDAARRRSERARRRCHRRATSACAPSSGCRSRSRATLTQRNVIRIGQLVGASTVVSGQLAFERRRPAVSTSQRCASTRAGSARRSQERGPLADLLATIERAARRLSPGATVPTAEVEQQHPPLAAFENFVKGLLAETPATQIGYLEKAIALAPDYDRARLALGRRPRRGGDWRRRRARRAGGRRRLAAAAAGAVRGGARGDRTSSGTTKRSRRLQALASQAPVAGSVQQPRRHPAAARPPTPQTGRATYYFNKAVELEPRRPTTTFNLGYAYWREQDNAAAVYWLRESRAARSRRRRRAFRPRPRRCRRRARPPKPARERELARRLSAAYEEGEDRTSPGPASHRVSSAVSTYLGRAGRAAARIRRWSPPNSASQRELATFHLDRGRRFFEREDDRDALTELQRAIYLSPYQAEAHLLVGPHLPAGRAHARGDRGAEDLALERRDGRRARRRWPRPTCRRRTRPRPRKEAERALALDHRGCSRRDEAAPAASELLQAAATGPIGRCYTVRSRALRRRGLGQTMSDEGFHEIQLNGKQLVFLFMAATVVSVVIFLCGVMVGRGVRSGPRRRRRRAPSSRRQPQAAPAPIAPRARASIERGGEGRQASRRRRRRRGRHVSLQGPDRRQAEGHRSSRRRRRPTGQARRGRTRAAEG